MINLNSLMVRKGQRLNRAFFNTIWRRLLLAIEERTVKRGRGTRVGHGPDGTIVRAERRGAGGAYVVHPWQITLDEAGDGKYELRFRQGFINGVEGKIGDKRLSELDANEEPPVLEVHDAHFGSDRVCRIYAKVEFVNAWFTTAVTLLPSATTKLKEDYTFYKLIGHLVKDAAGTVEVMQNVFFNLSVTPVGQKGGRATYVCGVA